MIPIINSRFEIGVVAYSSNKQPVEDSFTEILLVKFITELIEIAL